MGMGYTRIDVHVIVDCAKNRRSTGVYSAAELAYYAKTSDTDVMTSQCNSIPKHAFSCVVHLVNLESDLKFRIQAFQ